MAQTWEGELPEAARTRMHEIRGSSTWGSALSTQEFNAIKGVGFDPVGQVLGTAVFQIGYQGGYGCSGAWSGYLGQNDDVVYVGVGTASDAKVTVRWPRGASQTIGGVAVDRIVDVREGP